MGTAGSSVQLLDVSTGGVKRSFRAHEGVIHLLKFSPDARNLAIGSFSPDGDTLDFRLWSLEEEGSLELGNTANSVSFSADSQQLLVREETGTLRLWNLNRRAEVERFSADARWAELLPDGRVFSATRGGKLSIWQTGHSSQQQLRGYPNVLRTLAFTPDSQWLIAAGMDRQVFVWNARDSQLAGIYTNHLSSAFAVAPSPDGHVATASYDRIVQAWDPASRRMLWQASLGPARDSYWLVYSPDARKLYVASHFDTVIVLDAMTGKRLNAINGLGAANILDGLSISPDGRLLAICQKVRLSVWSTDDLHKLWEAPADPERCAAFSPDNKWLATGDQDGNVTLWNIASAGRVRRVLSGHTASVSGVSFHPDGSRLVSCGFDGQVKVWGINSGAELLTLPLPGGVKAWHALFSPDGKTVAVAGADGIVTLWQTK